jgi:hypothetical protein
MGRRVPSTPTVSREALTVPSAARTARNTTMLAPGTRRLWSPGPNRTIGASGGTRTWVTPSLVFEGEQRAVCPLHEGVV